MTLNTSDRELSQRFLRRAVSARTVFAVACEQGLARVRSRHFRGREVALLWSAVEPAERWAAVLDGQARVKQVPLAEALADMLPALFAHQRLAGVDWTGEAAEPELDPRDLAERLRSELLESFMARAVAFGAVWTLGDALGPVMLASTTRRNALVMPCWSDERQADARREGPWAETEPVRIRLDDFLARTLVSLEAQGSQVAPEHILGAGSFELEPGDLKLRIGARRVVEV